MSIIVLWAFIKMTILDMVRTEASDNQNRDWGESVLHSKSWEKIAEARRDSLLQGKAWPAGILISNS